jgi:hypothetical protein
MQRLCQIVGKRKPTDSTLESGNTELMDSQKGSFVHTARMLKIHVTGENINSENRSNVCAELRQVQSRHELLARTLCPGRQGKLCGFLFSREVLVTHLMQKKII